MGDCVDILELTLLVQIGRLGLLGRLRAEAGAPKVFSTSSSPSIFDTRLTDVAEKEGRIGDISFSASQSLFCHSLCSLENGRQLLWSASAPSIVL